MVRLTDQQLDAIFAAARPLPPADRGRFLESLAAALRDYPEMLQQYERVAGIFGAPVDKARRRADYGEGTTSV
jgi:hypothetical protein